MLLGITKNYLFIYFKYHIMQLTLKNMHIKKNNTCIKH